MMLMEEAERIARDEHGSSKLAVISGIKTILGVNGNGVFILSVSLLHSLEKNEYEIFTFTSPNQLQDEDNSNWRINENLHFYYSGSGILERAYDTFLLASIKPSKLTTVEQTGNTAGCNRLRLH